MKNAILFLLLTILQVNNVNANEWEKLVPVYAAIDGTIFIDNHMFDTLAGEIIEKPEHAGCDMKTSDKDLHLYDKDFAYLYIKIKKFNVKSGDKVRKNELLGYIEREECSAPIILKLCKENCDPE